MPISTDSLMMPPPPPPATDNELKKSVKNSIRHANDSMAFLKLLERNQSGSALNKILDFKDNITDDLAAYTAILDKIKSGNDAPKEAKVDDFGSSSGTTQEFVVNINTGKLADNPLL